MKSTIIKIIFLNLLLISSIFANSLKEDINQLKTNSLKKKAQVVKSLYENYPQEDKLNLLLSKMVTSDLYYKESDGTFLIITKKEGENYHTVQLFDETKEEVINKKELDKVKTNNKLRSIIKGILAQMNLFSKKYEIRLKSAKNILANVTKDDEALLEKALKLETNAKIREVLLEAKTILDAKTKSGFEQIKAVSALGEFISSDSLATLKKIETTTDNKELKELAKKSISQVESSRSFYSFIETAFFGLSMGSVLLLAAIGLAITFGVMKVINMAHGEMMMIGAYTTYTLQQVMPNLIEYSILIAIPVAFIVSGIVGIIIERLVIRHLYGRPLETLLATFGISLILQQLVRTIYSPLNQEVKTPSWMSGAWEINSALSLTYNRLYIIIFAILVFVGILLILNKTSLGLKVRAVTQNRQMAQAMGIKTSLIDAMTFGIGSGIAGIAGVALSQLTNVGPNLGQAYIVDSFMVVVFGGVGNLWGTLIAAFTLGEINKFIEPVAGAVLAKVIILVFIILFIQKRPRGLFPQKGRDAQD
ncbi:MAG: urea ABC transporter permease subunit UrtB [Halarcobacter sp.]